MEKPSFLDFQVDHMTLLLDPKMYNLSYVVFRLIFGVGAEDLLYDKRKEWTPGKGDESMTFAVRVGQGKNVKKEIADTIIAVVQPTEPAGQRSHVREMLSEHRAAAHWQHIALRTPDLLAFHDHALKRGVQFITPVLKDEEEDLIQVFSGEWFFPGSPASGVFFEFLQRNPSDSQVKMLAERNREAWFRDEVFMGLYGEKENEYRSGKVTPFLPVALFEQIHERVGHKNVWEITDEDFRECEKMMKKHAPV
jgi:hypothetical protein